MMGTRPIYAGNGSTAVMSPWHEDYGGPLRSDQIRALATFIVNWKQTALGIVELVELELPASDPQDPRVIDRGSEAFRKKCGRCHRYRELKQPEIDGPDLSGIAESDSQSRGGRPLEEYLIESVLLPRALVDDRFAPFSDQHPCGAVLTQSQLSAIVALLMQ